MQCTSQHGSHCSTRNSHACVARTGFSWQSPKAKTPPSTRLSYNFPKGRQSCHSCRLFRDHHLTYFCKKSATNLTNLGGLLKGNSRLRVNSYEFMWIWKQATVGTSTSGFDPSCSDWSSQLVAMERWWKLSRREWSAGWGYMIKRERQKNILEWFRDKVGDSVGRVFLTRLWHRCCWSVRPVEPPGCYPWLQASFSLRIAQPGSNNPSLPQRHRQGRWCNAPEWLVIGQSAARSECRLRKRLASGSRVVSPGPWWVTLLHALRRRGKKKHLRPGSLPSSPKSPEVPAEN